MAVGKKISQLFQRQIYCGHLKIEMMASIDWDDF